METETKTVRSAASTRARAAAYVGLSVALIAVSAWVTVPVGPIPFTLQMFAIPLIICLFPPRWAIAAVASYIVLGAIGVPLFSGFRGGIGVMLGPTGGFLWGYTIGVAAASLFLNAMRRILRGRGAIFFCEVAAGLMFTAIAYMTGCIQYSAVAGIGLDVAFLTSCAPFIVPDIAKVILAALAAQPIQRAVDLTAR